MEERALTRESKSQETRVEHLSLTQSTGVDAGLSCVVLCIQHNLDYLRYPVNTWILYFASFSRKQVISLANFLKGNPFGYQLKTYIHYGTTHNSQDVATASVISIKYG